MNMIRNDQLIPELCTFQLLGHLAPEALEREAVRQDPTQALPQSRSIIGPSGYSHIPGPCFCMIHDLQ